MRKYLPQIVLIAVATWLVGATGYDAVTLAHQAKQAQTERTAAAAYRNPTPRPLNPLTIVAMRRRNYAPSPLQTTAELPGGAGYTAAIASFTSDGLKEFALVDAPTSPPPPGGWPVVIFAHGYIDPSQYVTADNDYQLIFTALTQNGYMVVKPDYRGFGHSQGQPLGADYSPYYSYDVLNLIASLKADPQVNAKRLGLLGVSMGGGVALRTMVVSNDIKGSALINGVVGSMYDLFYNWPGNTDLTEVPAGLVTATRQRLVTNYGTPKTDPAFWDSASPINYVSAIGGPIQVDQDTGDSHVPALFSDHLVQALQRAHKNVTDYAYPGDDHNFTQPGSLTLLVQRLVSFYKAAV